MAVPGRTWVGYISSANNCAWHTLCMLNGWVDGTGIGGNIQHPTAALRLLFIPFKWDLVLGHLLNLSHVATGSA